MGLITMLLVFAFSAFYLSRSLEKKPALLVNVVDKSKGYLDAANGFCQKTIYCDAVTACAGYGLVVAVLTLMMRYGAVDMLIRFAANMLVVLMALPFIFDSLTQKYGQKLNPAIMNEVKNFISWIARNEKNFGYVGGACGALLFVVLFR